MTHKSEPKAQTVDQTQGQKSRADQVSLKGEKGQYNEILRPSEREDQYIAPTDKAEGLRSQTSDAKRPRPQ